MISSITFLEILVRDIVVVSGVLYDDPYLSPTFLLRGMQEHRINIYVFNKS